MHRIKSILRKIPCLPKFYSFSIYLYWRYLKEKLYKKLYLSRDVEIINVFGSDTCQSFFGYYNVSPFNKLGDVLCCELSGNYKNVGRYESVSLCVKNLNMSTKIGSSNAWNWQQGCMLQWYGDANETIIYNDYSVEENAYISVIKNIKNGHVRKINYPVYSVSNDGVFALSLNFDRLALLRPDYGYSNRKVSWEDIPDDTEDGVYYIDLIENKRRLILSLDVLKNYKPTDNMKSSMHKVNHIDISPGKQRFMFLHRWIGPEGRFMRLLSANCSDGKDLYCITGNQMVSHNCWWGEKDIISFCRIHDGRDRYVHFKDQVGFVKLIGEHTLLKDGHPTVSPDGLWMIADEYPGKSRYSKLLLYNLKKETIFELGRFYQPHRFLGENRIDLHPRWDVLGQGLISIDSGHQGERRHYVLNVERITKNESS